MTTPLGSGRGPLFTDHYQLVMAQLYLQEGMADRQAQFDYFYRSNPDYGSHQAGFCVTAGLGPLLEWMAEVAVGPDDIAALRQIRSGTGAPVFTDAFLEWLGEHGHFRDLQVDAVGEGRVVHPHVPIAIVSGPLAQAQLLETALLNALNYPTLIATKAARIVESARGAACLEFGMRRGAGTAVDEGARAALIAGFAATSNVQAAVATGTDPRGTHAHSLVQAYMADGQGELGAFRAFARAYPDDCVLLVDTIDTLRSGIPNAITVFEELRQEGHQPAGIRLDSGDLAHLGVQAAKMLDEAGFTGARIVLSGELDELTIWQITTQMQVEAEIEGVDWPRLRGRLVHGVGTRLITSAGDSALGGVYKLVGLQDGAGEWVPAIKVSDSPVKVPIPGRKQVWRLYDDRGQATADVVTGPDTTPFEDGQAMPLLHPHVEEVSRTLRRDQVSRVEPLHRTVFAGGGPTQAVPPINELAATCRDDIRALPAGVRRMVNPHTYHVSLDEPTKRLQRELVARARAAMPGRDG